MGLFYQCFDGIFAKIDFGNTNFCDWLDSYSTHKKINYSDKLFFIGSCFSENIGERFNYYKFQTTVNPFGIIFNSVSLEKLSIPGIVDLDIYDLSFVSSISTLMGYVKSGLIFKVSFVAVTI